MELGLSQQVIWAILALYTNVLGRIKVPGGWSDEIRSTIGVKQGCPLSPTLFGLYIDELESFIAALGGEGSTLADECISILLYADDVVLISSSPEGLQQHLVALEKFCAQRELKVNLDKTKVMVFNTSRACMHRSPFFFMDQQVEVVSHYTYLGVQFKGSIFSMKDAAYARLTKGYASLAMLERKCFQADFQDVPAKLHLFNTLVRPAALYGGLMWGMDMTTKEWTQIERLQIYFLSKMIMSKASVPHPIILAEFSATPLQLDAAFQLVFFLHKVRHLGHSQQGQNRLPWIALKSSKRLAEKGVQECWYAKASQWAAFLGFRLDNLPPFQ